MFRANIENCEAPKYEKIIDGYFEFLFVDKNGNPVVAKDIVSKVKYCSRLQTAISERLKNMIYLVITKQNLKK